jgi:hypothetical protein
MICGDKASAFPKALFVTFALLPPFLSALSLFTNFFSPDFGSLAHLGQIFKLLLPYNLKQVSQSQN